MIEPLTKCHFCATPYNEERVQVIKIAGERDYFHVTCSSCYKAMFYCIEHHRDSLSCSGIITDCDAADAQRFYNKPRLTLDDVLQAHLALSTLKIK